MNTLYEVETEKETIPIWILLPEKLLLITTLTPLKEINEIIKVKWLKMEIILEIIEFDLWMTIQEEEDKILFEERTIFEILMIQDNTNEIDYWYQSE